MRVYEQSPKRLASMKVYSETYRNTPEFRRSVEMFVYNFRQQFGIGYVYLHKKMKAMVSKPETCQLCGEKKTLELANISKHYMQIACDWTYLCRQCHRTFDAENF